MQWLKPLSMNWSVDTLSKRLLLLEDEYSEAGFGFVVSINGVNKVVHVLMDAEGNGPGFLDIQEATNE